MAVKPILFNTDMVRALLDGRKTVTRRVVKPQPLGNFPYCHLEGDDLWYWTTRDGDDDMMDWWPLYERGLKPPYQPGDILYVRETEQKKQVGAYLYKADTINSFDLFITPDGRVVNEIPWRPSIHMPKEAARIFLRVTEVRPEQLQDMTEEDAKAEGFTTRTGAIQAILTMYPCCTEDSWFWVNKFQQISREEAMRNT